jgi:hypothetical protein
LIIKDIIMNSKFLRMLGLGIVVVCTVMAFHAVSAQEAEAPAEAPAAVVPVTAAPDIKPAITSALELRKTGIVSVVKDAGGAVTGLKLIVNSYDIPLDEGSKPLESMDGQKVRVTGTFSNEGGKRMFYVKSVEPVAVEGTTASPAK